MGTQSGKGPKQAGKGPKQAGKGPKQAGKGPKQAGKGGSNEVAEDVFRRVHALGGLLVVAFVTQVAATSQDSRSGSGPRDIELSHTASDARQRDKETAEQASKPAG